jgi:hypothetical protein
MARRFALSRYSSPGRSGSFQRGFSLAELAIVGILFGLLTGLVIVGEGIVTQSRIKSAVNDIEAIKIAVLTYYDRYQALPGDDNRAAGRWTVGAKDGTGDGRVGGSYQDAPVDPPTSLTITAPAGDGESLNFWWHLRLAELINAPPPQITMVAQPLNYYGGVFGVQWAPLGFPRLAACMANLPANIAIGIESQLDDGLPNRGLLRAARQNPGVSNEPLASANAAIAAYEGGDDIMYILCRRLD